MKIVRAPGRRLLTSILAVASCVAPLASVAPRRQGAKEVTLSVAVTGKGGAPVTGLPREAFALTSGKDALEITSFEAGGPAAVAVLFDVSGSIASTARGSIKPATEAVWRLAEAGHESNEYSVVAFASDVHTLLAGSNDRGALRDALALVRDAGFGRQSSILDACWRTLRTLSAAPHAKRAVILLTDGADTYSRARNDDVLRELKEGGAVVYAVYLGERPDSGLGEYGSGLLKGLAEVSGGLACFPQDAKQMDACFARIGEDLRARYVVTFNPTAPPEPGRCRPVKVRVTPPAGSPAKSFKVRAREEFCAPGRQK